MKRCNKHYTFPFKFYQPGGALVLIGHSRYSVSTCEVIGQSVLRLSSPSSTFSTIPITVDADPPTVTMKLFDCENNFYGIKTTITLEATHMDVKKDVINPKEKVVPFLSRRKLPVLELDDGTHLFNCNAICRLLWEKAGKTTIDIEDEEWCEWESAKLQPAVAVLLLETLLHGKADAGVRTVLNSHLQRLDTYLSKHSKLSRGTQVDVADFRVLPLC